MRAAARSVVFVVVSTTPWMASCVGSGGDPTTPMASEGGSDASSAGDGANGDGPASDATLGDALPVDGASADAASGDGSADVTKAIATTSTVAGLRVANWSPDAPNVDFCIALHGSGAYQGPVLAAALRDAGGGALDFPKVSAYSLLTPGVYDVRIVVAAPGVDCSLGGLLVRDATLGLDAGLAPGSTTTLALVGMAQSPAADSGVQLQLVVLSDDAVGPAPKVLDGGAVTERSAVRFVHAAPGLSVADLSGTPIDLTGSGLMGSKWSFKGVSFGHANPWKDGGSPEYDRNSYQLVSAVPPTATVNVVLEDAGAPDAWPPTPTVPVAAGTVLTIVLTGTPASSMGAAVQLLACDDNAGTTSAYSTCHTLSVSTCGNGVREAFEDCDCGLSGVPTTDPQCISSALPQHNDVLPYVCSTTCHLN